MENITVVTKKMVQVSTKKFEWSHGRKPKGQGNWMFWLFSDYSASRGSFDSDYEAVAWSGENGNTRTLHTLYAATGAEYLMQVNFRSFADAKKLAVSEAAKRGLSFVEVAS